MKKLNERRKEIGSKHLGRLSESNVPNMAHDFSILVQNNELSDEEYSVLLGSIWQRGRTEEWTTANIKSFFSSPKCIQELLMSEEDYKYFKRIESTDMTLYRCMSKDEFESRDYRASWTMSLEVALGFWRRSGMKDEIACLPISDANRDNVQLKAYFSHREEKEIILLIGNGISEIRLIPKEFFELYINNNVYKIETISEDTLCELKRDEDYRIIPNFGPGECIMNAHHLASFVENSTEKYLVEGIVISEDRKIFPHMWNRFIINDESNEYDVTHDLLMRNTPPFSYYKICEYDVNKINKGDAISFSNITMFISRLLWELYPQSKP